MTQTNPMDRYNFALERLESQLQSHTETPLDVADLARHAHTTEHHFRRVFATLTGMGLAEYVRRRRMTLASAAVIAGEDHLIDIALSFGYDSADAFSRAFRAVHGVSPSQARQPGATLTTQPRVTLHLVTEGQHTMKHRIETTPALRLVGRSTRVPLVGLGPNPAITDFVASIPVEDTIALKQLNNVAPHGVLAVTGDFDGDREDGTLLSYLHGVATTGDSPEGADVIDQPASTWAVFTPGDPSDETLQRLWSSVIAEWLPANNWRLALGPEIVAMRVDEQGLIQRELWIPVAQDR